MNKIQNLFEIIRSEKKSHFWIFLFILLFMSFAMVYFYQPLCQGHDFIFHYMRFQALMEGLKTSPYLIYLDYNAIDGYGYFTKAFYSDFVLIPFAAIGNVTGSYFAYQFMLFTMTVLCGVFTYIAINVIYKNSFVAAIGSVLYTFCMYRLLDIFHRAALGESLSFTFVPIVFLGLYYIVQGDYRRWYVFTIGFSLMILTHLISTVLMFVTCFILILIYYKSLIKEPKRIVYLIFSGLLCIFLAAYYLYPMFEQMLSNTFYYNAKNIMAKAQDTGYGIHKLIWGMFTGIIHPRQVFTAGTGFTLTVCILLRIFVFEKSKELLRVDIGVLIGVAYIIASFNYFPWSVFPFSLLNFIQLPWRLFEFSSYFFAIAGAFYLYTLLKFSTLRLFIAGSAIIFLNLVVIVSDSRFYKDVICQNSITEVATVYNNYNLGGLEYMPSQVPSAKFIADRGKSIVSNNKESISTDYNQNRGITSFQIEVSQSDVLELPLLYYKGYAARLNNQPIEVTMSENGLLAIPVNKSGRVEVYYAGTMIQKIGYLTSVVSILILMMYIVWFQRKIEKN